MFATVAIALALAAALFVGYLLLKAYKPDLVKSLLGQQKQVKVVAPAPAPAPVEPFVASPPPPAPTQVNTAPPPVTAPAPPVKQDMAVEPPRVVSPGGPSSPNAEAPPETVIPSMSPEVKPIDPYDDHTMEAPIHDSMRHPELSFGPGIDNTGMNKLATSGVGSMQAAAAESPFSPEFAQNGGSFMGDVFANDLTKDDRYAMV